MRLSQHAAAAANIPADRRAGEALASAGDVGWIVVVGEDARPLGVLSRAELAGLDPAERLERVLVARPVPCMLVVAPDAEVADPRLPVVLGSLQGELPPRSRLGARQACGGAWDRGVGGGVRGRPARVRAGGQGVHGLGSAGRTWAARAEPDRADRAPVPLPTATPRCVWGHAGV
jgi:hypothetical protein